MLGASYKLLAWLSVLGLLLGGLAGCSLMPTPTPTLLPPPTPIPPTRRPTATYRLLPPTWTLPATTHTPTPYPTPIPSWTPSLTFTLTPSRTSTAARATPTFDPALLATLRIAAVHSGHVWLWTNGVSTSLTSATITSTVRLADDGQVVVFQRGGDLWGINSDGSDERVLVSETGLQALELVEAGVKLNSFEFIPGTHQVLFNTVISGTTRLTDDLHTVNADTLYSDTLAAPGAGGKFYLSPDGLWVVCVRADATSLMGSNGSNRQVVLIYPPVLATSLPGYAVQPVWAADSLSFRLVIPPDDVLNDPQARMVIWSVPVDGTPAQKLGAARLDPAKSTIFLAPDLTRLAYTRPNAEQQGRIEIHLANIDFSQDVLYLMKKQAGFVGWAPDSYHFIIHYAAWDTLYWASPDSEPVLLTDVEAETVRWVDGLHFLFVAQRYPNAGLRLGTPGEPSVLLFSETPSSYDVTR